MSPLEWIFWAFLAVLWASAIFLFVQDFVRYLRDRRNCRRLARSLKAEAEPYRDLDLKHPIGRARLGIRNKEEE